MRVMGQRFARSWTLAKESIGVLRQNPSLMWFPIISGIVTIILSISFFVPVFLLTGGKDLKQINPAIGYPAMAAFYLVSYFVVIFFNAGLVSCAHQGLMGRKTTFSDGLANAAKHLLAILGWSLIAATVGMILQLIAERSGLIGRIIVGLLGAAWNIVTYFVLPIIVVEDGSPVASIKKSGNLLRKTWGETVVGTGGISLVIVWLALPPIILIALAFMTGVVEIGIVVVGLSALYWLGLAIVGAAMQGIYQTALYVYAETGSTPQGFTQSYITDAFKPKPVGMIDKLRNR
jgi:hypothetical protein